MSRSKKTKQRETKSTSDAKAGFRHWGKLALGLVTLVVALGAMLLLPQVNMADTPEITVYKSASCGCCGKWVDHLRDQGFKVITHNREDMNQVKQSYGVEYKLRSCHTATVAGYVLEGHVPAEDIRRLLKEGPSVTGLAVPGMPMGSPGMEGNYQDPYDVIAFNKDGQDKIYARY